MFFLAPKYDLVDFVAFSGDSQNTDCRRFGPNTVMQEGPKLCVFPD